MCNIWKNFTITFLKNHDHHFGLIHTLDREDCLINSKNITQLRMILRTFTRHLLKPTRPIKAELKAIDYAICIDLECTCDSPLQIHPMEVIEIACFKVDISNYANNKSKTQIFSNDKVFHKFVKPTVNPELTLFCQDLTGIMQSTVDKSQTIDKVIKDLFEWLKKENLIDNQLKQKESFAFASCGNYDLNILSPIIKNSLFNNDLELLPIYFKEWINIKKLFVNHKREWPKGLYHMMELLSERPEGRLHSAKDDCLNLAKVVECLHEDGCKFHITSKLN